jgi:hypothetical protein
VLAWTALQVAGGAVGPGTVGLCADPASTRVRAGVSTELPTSLPLALAPLPDVGFVLQAGAVGTALGTAVAARARHRDPDVDATRITGAWTSAGLAVGSAVAAVSAVVQAVG